MKCSNPDCQNETRPKLKTCSRRCQLILASIHSKQTKVNSPWYNSETVGNKKKKADGYIKQEK